MTFSIIIPLYNKSPYVKKALESIYAQTFRDFELIVVDDGSTDESYSVAKSSLIDSGTKYQLIHQGNLGASVARNNGVAASRGDYVCFLDADDWWSASFLERIDWLIREFPEAGIYGSNYYYVKNGRQRVCVKSAKTGYINYCKVYSDGLAMPLTSISVAINREVFEKTGGFNPKLKLGEDFDLWIRIALKFRVAFLNEPLAYYFQDSDPEWRGIGKLQSPQHHMLWNVGYLEKEERTNLDYKRLIDRLRTYGLLPYYLSSLYRESARQELAKVDWSNQPDRIRKVYSTPIVILKFKRAFMKAGSKAKQLFLKHL